MLKDLAQADHEGVLSLWWLIAVGMKLPASAILIVRDPSDPFPSLEDGPVHYHGQVR